MLPAKYRIHALLILVALLIIFIPQFNERPDKAKAAAAQAAADAFLQRVDHDQFAASWESAATLLRNKVTEADWVSQLQRTREIAGPVVKRTLKSMSYSTSAKDSPDGEYILIVYDTAFKAKSDATETLTVMLDTDKTWRVAGYFIK